MTRAAVKEDGVEGRAADKRMLSVGVGATIAVILLALALVFANSFGATRVAQNARALHWTNATLGAAAIARASNAQAVVYAVDSDLQIVAPAAMLARALTVATRVGAVMDGVAETGEVLHGLVDDEQHPSPAASVAAVRPALGYVGLASK